MNGAQKLQEPDVPRQGALAATAQHAPGGLEQRDQTLGPLLVPVPTCGFLLRGMHSVRRLARAPPVAAGRVRSERTADLPGEVGGLLPRLDRTGPGRVDHAAPLTAPPGDERGPLLVVLARPGLAWRAAPPWRAAQ